MIQGAAVKMDHHFQPAVDPRKQELLEARFLGARVSLIILFCTQIYKLTNIHVHLLKNMFFTTKSIQL